MHLGKILATRLRSKLAHLVSSFSAEHADFFSYVSVATMGENLSNEK